MTEQKAYEMISTFLKDRYKGFHLIGIKNIEDTGNGVSIIIDDHCAIDISGEAVVDIGLTENEIVCGITYVGYKDSDDGPYITFGILALQITDDSKKVDFFTPSTRIMELYVYNITQCIIRTTEE
jgi:hypothetical protein